MATAPELEALTALFSASLQAGQHKQGKLFDDPTLTELPRLIKTHS
jgi:hypothetical protein